MDPLELTFRLLFGGIGLVVLGFAVWLTAGRILMTMTFEHAVAEVISSERRSPPGAKPTIYNVRVRIPTGEGRSRTAYIDDASTSYEPGEKLNVYFDPERGWDVKGGSAYELWFLPVVLFTISGIMLYFGIAKGITEKRSARLG